MAFWLLRNSSYSTTPLLLVSMTRKRSLMSPEAARDLRGVVKFKGNMSVENKGRGGGGVRKWWVLLKQIQVQVIYIHRSGHQYQHVLPKLLYTFIFNTRPYEVKKEEDEMKCAAGLKGNTLYNEDGCRMQKRLFCVYLSY